MKQSCLLQARNIGRRPPGTNDWLLRDVSLCLSAGERLAVVGPSGSGKTLLLRALAAIDPLDAGEVLWRGEVVPDTAIPEFRSQVIYLDQRPSLLEGTVESNLVLPYKFHVNRRRRYDRARAVRLLERLGRDAEFLDKSAVDLSGGEAQIAALIRAVQLEAAVYLFDEPTAALDRAATQKAETMIHSWFEEQGAAGAYIWVTHDHEQTQRMADRVLTLDNGRFDETT